MIRRDEEATSMVGVDFTVHVGDGHVDMVGAVCGR